MGSTVNDLVPSARQALSSVARFLTLPSQVAIEGVDLAQEVIAQNAYPVLAAPAPGFPPGWRRVSKEIKSAKVGTILFVAWYPPGAMTPISVEVRNLERTKVTVHSMGVDPISGQEWTRVDVVTRWSGVAWSDHRMLLAMATKTHTAPDSVRDACAKKMLAPDPKSTKDTGSANMEMSLPVDVWIHAHGRFPESILALEMYRLTQIRRPRQWYATHFPAGINANPAKVKFPGWPELGFDATNPKTLWEWFFNAEGLNPGDSMHPDDSEHASLVRHFQYPPALEGSLALWTLLDNASSNWRMTPDNIGTGSPRVFGWALRFTADLLIALTAVRAIDRSQTGKPTSIAYDPIVGRVWARLKWLINQSIATFDPERDETGPTPNPWYYGGDANTKEGKLDFWQDWQFHVLAFGLARASVACRKFSDPNLGATPGLQSEVTSAGAMALDCAIAVMNWIEKFAVDGVTSYIRSVDGSYRAPSQIPGTGSWAIPAGDAVRIESDVMNSNSDVVPDGALQWSHVDHARKETAGYFERQPTPIYANPDAVKVLCYESPFD